MNDTRGKDKREGKLINCQRLLGFAECIYQYRDDILFCLLGQEKWKMLDIFHCKPQTKASI